MPRILCGRCSSCAVMIAWGFSCSSHVEPAQHWLWYSEGLNMIVFPISSQQSPQRNRWLTNVSELETHIVPLTLNVCLPTPFVGLVSMRKLDRFNIWPRDRTMTCSFHGPINGWTTCCRQICVWTCDAPSLIHVWLTVIDWKFPLFVAKDDALCVLMCISDRPYYANGCDRCFLCLLLIDSWLRMSDIG